ncbi:sigma D regulator [Chromohalobacter israelensis]
MLEDTKTALERWGGVHTLIDRWLEQRRDMLVTLVELQEACDAELETVTKERIDAFSETLMDYISGGHFEIYPQLRDEAVAFDDQEALALADHLLARLEMSTQMVLEFDNDYSTPARCQHYTTRLPAWLERLTKGLAERFALEDQLIARLHAAHAPSHASKASTSPRALS